MNYEISSREKRKALAELELRERAAKKIKECWRPLPGPQMQAYKCKADILLYGGAAGGGKSDLLLGVAKDHERGIIFRREYPQLEGIIDRAEEIFGEIGEYTSSNKRWILDNRNIIQFGSVKDPKDVKKYQGRAHGFKGFDEITHFTETQFRFLIGWTRQANKKLGEKPKKTRIVCAGNPPMSSEERWVIDFWAPWLDDKHQRPAKPGELRWFTTINGKDQEVESGEPFKLNGDLIVPESRTFIPARIEDNPYLLETGYKSKLQAMREPLRSIMLLGDFLAGIADDAWQLIPTAWIKQAQARWREQQKPNVPMSALGVDVARGGKDRTCLAPRYNNWFENPHVYPGKDTPDGQYVCGLILKHARDEATVNIDVIGVGASAFDITKDKWKNTVPLHSAEKSEAMDKTGLLSFVNFRAEMWWKFMEALDPNSGENLAIPDDPEILADLCAMTWKMKTNGIQMRDKEEIIEQLGRSPDKGESILYAFTIKETPQARITII